MTVLFNIQFVSSMLAVRPSVFPEHVPTNKFSGGEGGCKEFETQLKGER